MKNDLPTPLLKMYSLASANESYNTRQNVKFKIKPQICNTVLASNSIVHVGPQIWNSIPEMLYTNKGLLATAAGFAFRYKRTLLGGYV